jgi:hypothetical protein
MLLAADLGAGTFVPKGFWMMFACTVFGLAMASSKRLVFDVQQCGFRLARSKSASIKPKRRNASAPNRLAQVFPEA